MKNIRTAFTWASLTLAIVPALQGCFPLVAGGIGAGAMMAADRRSSGAYVEDEGLEWKIQNRINQRYGDKVHVNAVSYNRNVLLTGEVPDEATKEAVGRIATEVPNIRGITNEVQVGPISSFGSRSNDAYITSKVKARFVDAATFGVQHVKVYTEAGSVYLMGLVTQREAEAATNIARTTTGVKRVVRVFEYISEDEALRLQSRPAEPQSASQKR